MASANLQGLTVLVTRPMPAGEQLCEKIRAAGGEAIYFPTITILPPASFLLLKQQIARLDQFDCVIFISPQAVYQAEVWLHAAWPTFPKALCVAAIGPGTALALKKANLPMDICPGSDFRSEGLLDLPAFQSIAGKKIALIQGEGGRSFLTDELLARGAKVEPLVVYRRGLPATTLARDTLQRVHIIVCTSNDIIKNLKQLLGASTWRDACQLPMLVISDRMRAFAEQQGIKHILGAKGASHDAIMTVLTAKKDDLCQVQKKM